MNDPKQVREARTSYAISTNETQAASVVNLGSPIILERDGQPMAMLMSIQEYERYQSLLEQHQKVSALEARRAADRIVFGDLVGCALSSGNPIWTSTPDRKSIL